MIVHGDEGVFLFLFISMASYDTYIGKVVLANSHTGSIIHEVVALLPQCLETLHSIAQDTIQRLSKRDLFFACPPSGLNDA
jgi:hypothetical protein